ncbi:hypothetical protein HJFPF1_07006 [Paramyrothecium foliicola]|nr:hypothetical protein HJFPF1_07006 [Paramyrothecium foliicola]
MDFELRQKLRDEYEELKGRFAANDDNLCRADLARLEALLNDGRLGVAGPSAVRRLERKMKACFERNNDYEDLLSLFEEAPEHMDPAQLEELASLHGKLHPSGQETLGREIDGAVKERKAAEEEAETPEKKGRKNRKSRKAAGKQSDSAAGEEKQ